MSDPVEVPDPVGVHIVNDDCVMVRWGSGTVSEIPRRVYEDCDYRPSFKNLPSAQEYRVQRDREKDDEGGT